MNDFKFYSLALALLMLSCQKDDAEGCLKHLNIKDMEVQAHCIQLLGEKRDKRAVVPLIEKLKDTTGMNWWAAGALGEIGDKRAIQPLLDGIFYGNPQKVNHEAIIALGKLGDQTVMNKLIEAKKEALKLDSTSNQYFDKAILNLSKKDTK